MSAMKRKFAEEAVTEAEVGEVADTRDSVEGSVDAEVASDASSAMYVSTSLMLTLGMVPSPAGINRRLFMYAMPRTAQWIWSHCCI